jgi:hypothetical protein
MLASLPKKGVFFSISGKARNRKTIPLTRTSETSAKRLIEKIATVSIRMQKIVFGKPTLQLVRL